MARANSEAVQEPLPARDAWPAVAASVVSAVRLLVRRRIGQPTGWVGRWIAFADGTRAPVYRETVVQGEPILRPATLLVAFRLRGIRGPGHAWFRRESLLNTPLFVGFPGFRSKLWLAHDATGRYRGIYQWDEADLAVAYARALWRVLALVCEPGSIGYCVLPGAARDDVVRGTAADAGGGSPPPEDWALPLRDAAVVGR